MELVPLHLFIPFLTTCIIIELTPGPNMTYLTILSLTEGKKSALSAVIGTSIGLLLIGLISALGLGVIILETPELYQLIRWAGTIYLLWLAWDGWHSEQETSPHNTSILKIKTFKRGLIVNILNPKAALFYIAILPRFTSPEKDITVQAITLTLSYVFIATVIHILLVLLASRAKNLFDTPKLNKIIRRVLSLALVIVAIWFAWSTA